MGDGDRVTDGGTEEGDTAPDAGGAVEHVRDRRTNRWVGVVGAAVLAATLGMVARQPGLLLLGGVGAAVAAYARTARPPAATVRLERELDPAVPEEGETVTVRTTVHNVGDRTLPDLRLVDGVPDGLAVVDGRPRLGAALAPGAAATTTYEVAGGQGRHAFEPAEVALGDVAGVVTRRLRVAATTDAVNWDRTTRPAELPVQPENARRPGAHPSTDSGAGVTFHGVREYRPGDPMKRVDWTHLAKTGKLTTVEFRRARSERVVLLVDARRSAAVAPPDATETALDRSVTAAAALVDGLDDHAVGLAALSRTPCWMAPDGGRTHRRRLRETLAEHPAFRSPKPGAVAVDRLVARVPVGAHVVFLTPLVDDDAAAVARQLRARGHTLTVVSPAATATDTAGRRLAHLERSERLRELRRAGVRVFDWPPDRPFAELAVSAGRAR
jgi:uncharacterized repeat protein (TIGR01451 family)